MNIRKYTAVFFASLFLFGGCSSGNKYPTDDTYHFETDCQYSVGSQGKGGMIAESIEGYYFALTLYGRHFLFFTDKATMQIVPLCGKPNCLHYQETDEGKRELCNAHFMGVKYEEPVYFNNGRLYVPEGGAGKAKILEISPDGSSRKTLWELDALPNGDNLIFHRGYMYIALTSYDENMKAALKILRYSLDKPAKKPETIFERALDTKTGGGNAKLVYDLKAYGNHLYFTLTEENDTVFYTADLSKPQPTCESLLEDFGEEDDSWYYAAPSASTLLLALTNASEVEHLSGMERMRSLTSTIYRTELNGSNPQPLFTLHTSPYTSDGQYIYHWPLWVLWRDGGIDRYPICIYDLEGNLLVDHDAAEDAPDFSDLYVSTGEHVFLFAGSNKVYYFSKSEIETGEIHPKLLIDCSQYE